MRPGAPRWFRVRTAVALCVVAALGCEKKPATQVIVELHAEPGVLAAAATLRVVIESEEGKVVLDREKAVDPSLAKLARIPLIPKGEDATRRFRVRASLLDAGAAELSKLEARAGYVEDELLELELWFSDACQGKLDCGDGRTCYQGRCVGSCFNPGSDGPAAPRCGECQVCADSCQNQDGLACGCPGETCTAGTCEPGVRVGQVAAGSVSTCASLEGGDTYCWGSTTFGGNLNGQKGRLGTGDQGEDSAVPVKVPGITARKGITIGSNHTCTITFGDRACWGLNFQGELGGDIGSVVSTPHSFTETFALETIVSGFRHTCGLTQANELWCWGYNERGNLGLGDTQENYKVPTLVSSSYSEVAAGGDHTCAVDAAGQLFCWGFNDSTELGVPTAKEVPSPLRPGCEPENAGDSCFDDYRAVGVGAFHSCGIRESGEMRCFGGNLNGQLGIGPPTSSYEESEPRRVAGSEKWADVSGGRSYTCGLSDKGELFCWGLNEDRQLGIPGVDFVTVPTKVPVEAPGGWRFLSTGQFHACAIRADRTLWCWGRNSAGQIGTGMASVEPVEHPTRVCFPGSAGTG